jgi:hypothetical protein
MAREKHYEELKEALEKKGEGFDKKVASPEVLGQQREPMRVGDSRKASYAMKLRRSTPGFRDNVQTGSIFCNQSEIIHSDPVLSRN